MSGITTGGVRTVLRLEGLCFLVASVVGYAKYGSGWGIFVACFFVPDLSFLGYTAGARVGSVVYNMAHSYVGAVACLVAGVMFSVPLLLAAGFIWCAHIGFDRVLGYGLKYSQGFGFTHLGLIGREAREASQSSLKQTPDSTA